MLNRAISVATTQIGDDHYALVASLADDGLQIINITDPENPSPVANITDSTSDNPTDYTELDGASSVTTTQIGTKHYALVAATLDHGLQIIDITDPSSPSAAAAVTDGQDYPELKEAYSVTTAQIGGSHYALVAARIDDGLQIINITDPENPLPAAAVTDGQTIPSLMGRTR